MLSASSTHSQSYPWARAYSIPVFTEPLVPRLSACRTIVNDEDLFHRPGLPQDRVNHAADHTGIVPGVDLNEDPHCRSLFPSLATVQGIALPAAAGRARGPTYPL